MRRLLLLLLLLAAPALAADNVSLAPPKTVWDNDLDGTAIHRISTLPCPVSSGEFKRFNVQLYDKVGFDVGCDYRAPGAEITLYLTRIDPAAFDKHFEEARGAVVANRPGAVPREGTLALPPGFDWHRASFTLVSGLVSDVLMAPFHGWYFEARVSYAPERADITAATLATLSADALKTAGAHLAACEARPKPPADGARITDQNKLMGFALVGGALLGKMVDGKSGKTIEPVQPDHILSCADGSFSVGSNNFVFWHDTLLSDPAAERITGIERDFTATAREAFSPVANAVAAVQSTKTEPIKPNAPGVMVIVDRGDHWDMMSVFEGPPSMEDMAKAALLGQPFAQVNKAGNNITIFAPPAPAKTP